MYIIFTLIISILVSSLFVLLAKKLNVSAVIGLIITGIILGSFPLKNIILEPNTEFILSLGDVGLVFLMFLAGLEVSWSMLYKEKKNAAIVAVFAAFIPLLLGFVVFLALGFSLATALTIGICMSITAEATKAKVLLELKKLKTKIGSLMMGAGIIDDLIGMSLFAFITYWFVGTFAIEELALLAIVILAFFSGILVHKFIKREEQKIFYLEKFLMIFVVPFFFIAMGIHFNLQSLSLNPLLAVLIIIVAIAGKILGTLLTKPFIKLSLEQLYLIGWGMNSRGAVELSIAFIAFKVGLIDTDIYSSLIVMALVTTLLFPFFLRKMIKKNPNIMG